MWVWSFGMKTSYCWNQHTSVSFPARLFAHDFGPTCSSGNGQPQWPQWWGLWGLSRSHQCGLSLDELSLVWTLTGWWLLRLNLVLDLPEPGPTSGWIWWASWRGQGPLVDVQSDSVSNQCSKHFFASNLNSGSWSWCPWWDPRGHAWLNYLKQPGAQTITIRVRLWWGSMRPIQRLQPQWVLYQISFERHVPSLLGPM